MKVTIPISVHNLGVSTLLPCLRVIVNYFYTMLKIDFIALFLKLT